MADGPPMGKLLTNAIAKRLPRSALGSRGADVATDDGVGVVYVGGSMMGVLIS